MRVADFHTYFVGCEEWGFSVWAHNTCYTVYEQHGGGFSVRYSEKPGAPTKWATEANGDVKIFAKQADADAWVASHRAAASSPAAVRTGAMVRPGDPPVILTPMAGKTPLAGGRQTGIDRAWALEVDLVKKTGKGTAPWTDAEIARIKAGASYGDLGYTGHHINKVADYPGWAGDPRNIAFLKQGKGETHMRLGHPGGTQAPQPEGYLIDREAMISQIGKVP